MRSYSSATSKMDYCSNMSDKANINRLYIMILSCHLYEYFVLLLFSASSNKHFSKPGMDLDLHCLSGLFYLKDQT